MTIEKVVSLYDPVTLEDLIKLEARLSSMLELLKQGNYVPSGAKQAPAFTQARLGEGLLFQPKDFLGRRLEKAASLGLSRGHAARPLKDAGDDADFNSSLLYYSEEAPLDYKGRRYWSLKEARQWIKMFSPKYHKRKPGEPGAVITTALFKGGVSKTMTTACLAQGLSLAGFDTLVIDLDAQGSLSSLFGRLATDISFEETVSPIFLQPGSEGYCASLAPSIRPTYWDGVDIVSSTTDIFNAEFFLPVRQVNEPRFRFWDVLNAAIGDDLRQKYDFILIDTPPALSYTVVNALWASDGVIMPITADGLDFASSSSFWRMFNEMGQHIATREKPKAFKFVGVLRSKIDEQKPHTAAMLRLIERGYQDYLITAAIPETQVVHNTGASFRTPFDITRYTGSAKSFEKAYEAYTSLTQQIVSKVLMTMWGGKE